MTITDPLLLNCEAKEALLRIEPGTRLRVRWPFNGQIADRTFLRSQGTTVVFQDGEGRERLLHLDGVLVRPVENGFDVCFPKEPHEIACQYRFLTEGT